MQRKVCHHNNVHSNVGQLEAVLMSVIVKNIYQDISAILLEGLKAGVEKDILKRVITCPILVLHY